MSIACPEKKQLASFSNGLLTEEDSDQLFLHLQDCESCQQSLETIDRSNESEDTFIGSLRGAADFEEDQHLAEPGFRSATVKALAALANVESDAAEVSLPESIGEYEIVRPIGRGGMGRVFLGRHTKLGREVAIKVLAQHRRWDKKMHERFDAEMRAIGGLNHPNIVAAHDAREVDGVAVLVTEYVEGLDGSDLLKRKGRLSIANACKIGAELCKALGCVAEKGLVHRDVKPSNVMIDGDGNVKLLDLGLARIQTVEGEVEFTATGQAMGTADYVAPEQINDARNVDVRTDLYGLGCTLYKMIGGRAPFAIEEFATPFAKMNAHVSQPPTELSRLREDVPQELNDLIHQLLAKSPADRPATAGEVATRLDLFVSDSDLAAMVEDAQDLPEIQHRFEKATDLKLALQETAQPKGFLFSRIPLWATIGSVLAAVCAGMLLQIAITVEKPDGTKSTVTIPDGSTAVVDAEGNITVKLAGGGSGVIASDRVERVSPNYDRAKIAPAYVKGLFKSEVRARGISLEVSEEVYQRAIANKTFDVLVKPKFLKDEFTPAVIVASNVKSLRYSGDKLKDDFRVEIGFDRSGSQRCANATAEGYDVEVVPHNDKNVLKSDRYQLQGVWSGRLPNDVRFALLFHNDRVIFFGPGGYQKAAKFDVEAIKGDGKSRLMRVIGSDDDSAFLREWDKGEYWFGESNQLRPTELYVASKSLNGAITKLERDILPKHDVHLQAEAFLAKLKQEPVRLSAHLLDPDEEYVWGSDLNKLKFDPNPIITNREFVSVRVSKVVGPETAALYVNLTELAGDKLRFVTRANVGSHLVLKLDGQVVMAPKINSEIGSELRIEGDFTEEKLREIAKDLVPMSRLDRRIQSEDKLRALMVGAFNYESTHGVFLAVNHFVKGSKHPFSWRVAILPFIDQVELYKQFKFDEPWDSDHNMKVAAKMPDVFRLPGDKPDSFKTYYLAVAGKKTIFATDKPVGLGSITDGTSCTIAMIQDERSVIWTQPTDFAVDKETVRNLLAQNDPMFTFARGDGEVATIERSKLSETDLMNAMIRDDGQFLDYKLFANPDDPFQMPSQENYRDPEPITKGNIPAGVRSNKAPKMQQMHEMPTMPQMQSMPESTVEPKAVEPDRKRDPGVIQEGLPLQTPNRR